MAGPVMVFLLQQVSRGIISAAFGLVGRVRRRVPFDLFVRREL